MKMLKMSRKQQNGNSAKSSGSKIEWHCLKQQNQKRAQMKLQWMRCKENPATTALIHLNSKPIYL
jgi:hypothetical protein